MFGNTLFDIAFVSLGAIWILGWILLFSVMIGEKLIPSKTEQLEQFLKKSSSFLNPIQKYLFIVLVVLFAVRLLAGWLGWAEPLG